VFNNVLACKHGQTFGGIEQHLMRETACKSAFPLLHYATSGDIANHGETPDIGAPEGPQQQENERDFEVCNYILVGRLFDNRYEFDGQRYTRNRNRHLHSWERIALGDRGYPDGIDRPTFQISKSLQPQDANDPWWCTHRHRVADIHDGECISTACTYESLWKE
jgi:hypothetical protein